MEVFSWSSLAGRGTCTLLVNWLIYMFPKNMAATSNMGHTRTTVFKIMAWSFKAMQLGKWPSADWKGRRYDPTSVEG
eukprot:5647819-Alexandrium_andersonii.AAC.1